MKATKQELVELYHRQGLSLSKVAKRFGVCAQTILNWMRDYGIESRSLSEAWSVKPQEELERHVKRTREAGRKCKGRDRWNWRPDGSRRLETTGGSAGYISVKHQGQWIPEHRLVMEQHLGRPLTEQEEVHHKNQNKTDNRIENLELFADHSAHLQAFNHRAGEPNDLTEQGGI